MFPGDPSVWEVNEPLLVKWVLGNPMWSRFVVTYEDPGDGSEESRGSISMTGSNRDHRVDRWSDMTLDATEARARGAFYGPLLSERPNLPS
jgi:hypothetical protein